MLFLVHKRTIGFVLIVLLTIVFSTSLVYSQNTDQPQEALPAEEQQESNEEKAQRRRSLEEQIRAYDAEIERYQGEIDKYQAQGLSLITHLTLPTILLV